MATGNHEIIVALPAGRYQIQFTTEPNVSSAVIVPGRPVLPATINTRLERADGQLIAEPTSREYLTFNIEKAEAFRPQRLLVNITNTQGGQIYLNLSAGF